MVDFNNIVSNLFEQIKLIQSILFDFISLPFRYFSNLNPIIKTSVFIIIIILALYFAYYLYINRDEIYTIYY